MLMTIITSLLHVDVNSIKVTVLLTSLSLSLSPSLLSPSPQRTFLLFLVRPASPITRRTTKELWLSTRRLSDQILIAQVNFFFQSDDLQGHAGAFNALYSIMYLLLTFNFNISYLIVI